MIRSRLVRRNVRNGDGQTSAALEPEFWRFLAEICKRESRTLNEVIAEVDLLRGEICRASAIRVYIAKYYRAQAAARDDETGSGGLGLDSNAAAELLPA